MAVQFYSRTTQSRPERKDVTEQIELRKRQQAEADRNATLHRARTAQASTAHRHPNGTDEQAGSSGTAPKAPTESIVRTGVCNPLPVSGLWIDLGEGIGATSARVIPSGYVVGDLVALNTQTDRGLRDEGVIDAEYVDDKSKHGSTAS